MKPRTHTRRGAFLVQTLLPLLTASGLAGQMPGLTLAPEHAFLQSLVGEWTVLAEGEVVGRAFGRTRLQGQFVEVAITSDAGPVRNALYTFGFDTRHDHFTVLAMDDTGTYWVTGTGDREGETVTLLGTDDDPVMAEMGLEKAFVIELALRGPDAARLETRLIDTRTPERREMPFFGFDLRRGPPQ